MTQSSCAASAGTVEGNKCGPVGICTSISVGSGCLRPKSATNTLLWTSRGRRVPSLRIAVGWLASFGTIPATCTVSSLGRPRPHSVLWATPPSRILESGRQPLCEPFVSLKQTPLALGVTNSSLLPSIAARRDCCRSTASGRTDASSGGIASDVARARVNMPSLPCALASSVSAARAPRCGCSTANVLITAAPLGPLASAGVDRADTPAIGFSAATTRIRAATPSPGISTRSRHVERRELLAMLVFSIPAQ